MFFLTDFITSVHILLSRSGEDKDKESKHLLVSSIYLIVISYVPILISFNPHQYYEGSH